MVSDLFKAIGGKTKEIHKKWDSYQRIVRKKLGKKWVIEISTLLLLPIGGNYCLVSD